MTMTTPTATMMMTMSHENMMYHDVTIPVRLMYAAAVQVNRLGSSPQHQVVPSPQDGARNVVRYLEPT